MSEPLRAWFDRSRSWSTKTQVAFSILIIAGVAAGVGTLTQVDDRPSQTATTTSAQPVVVPTAPASTVPGPITDPYPTAPTTPASIAPTTAAVALDALTVLQSIPIELEHHEDYSRDLFAIWSDLDGDGCDTRQEVLTEESAGLVQTDPVGCYVLAGDWSSSYDGATLTDPADVDIDHVVALKEAWDSGAWEWTAERRIAYGNDLTDPRTLAAVSTQSNEQKGDGDPSNWLPTENVCTFIADWIAVKARWAMTMDESEWFRLRNLLTGQCLGTTIKPWQPIP